MVTAGAIAVALTGCKEQGQVLRVAGLKKTLLESLGQGLRASTGYETAGSNGIAVLNLQSSFLRGDDAYFFMFINPPDNSATGFTVVTPVT